jgi:hypothetical protein
LAACDIRSERNLETTQVTFTPVFSGIAASPVNSDLNTGAIITLKLKMNEVVTVTGTSELMLNDAKEAVPVWTRFAAQLSLNARFFCHARAVRSGQRIKRHVVFLAAQPEIAERALGDAGRQLEAIDQVR